MPTLASLDRQIAECQRKILALLELRRERLKITRLHCSKCKKDSMLPLWILRRPVWRLPPSKEHLESRKEKETSEIRFVCPCCASVYRLGDEDNKVQRLVIAAKDIMIQGEDFPM